MIRADSAVIFYNPTYMPCNMEDISSEMEAGNDPEQKHGQYSTFGWAEFIIRIRFSGFAYCARCEQRLGWSD